MRLDTPVGVPPPHQRAALIACQEHSCCLIPEFRFARPASARSMRRASFEQASGHEGRRPGMSGGDVTMHGCCGSASYGSSSRCITASTECRTFTFMQRHAGEIVVISIQSGEILAGSVPARALRLIQEWVRVAP